MEGYYWVKTWSAESAILLVWGSKALGNVNNSDGHMYRSNTTLRENMFKENDMRVVVFDANPLSFTRANVNHFGGTPTLVIDMSKQNHMQTLLPILRGRAKVFCLHTPFYLERPAMLLTKSAEKGRLDHLMNGSRKFGDEKRNIVLGTLIHESCDRALLAKTCSSCMGIFTEAELRPNDWDCMHTVCGECRQRARLCYHAEHARGFLTLEERVLPDSPFNSLDFNL